MLFSASGGNYLHQTDGFHTTASSTNTGQMQHHFKSSSSSSSSSSSIPLQTSHPSSHLPVTNSGTLIQVNNHAPTTSGHHLHLSQNQNNDFLISCQNTNDNHIELSSPTTNSKLVDRTDHQNNSNNSNNSMVSNSNGSSNEVRNVMLYGIPIVSLLMDGQERLCLAQISNTLLKNFSYNEIHNRRVALGITCVQCTPVQLELLRRAGAMPVSSRRCGMITKREAERLCKSFLAETEPPKLPESFSFDVFHSCAWGCRGSFTPSRYNSSRAKCIKCSYCGLFFSPNKFIFHSHRLPSSKYVQPDAANFNSWRRHIKLVGSPEPADHVIYAWEDVKAMFNGGSRKRAMTSTLNSFTKNQEHNSCSSSNNHRSISNKNKNHLNSGNSLYSNKIYSDDNNNNSGLDEDSDDYTSSITETNKIPYRFDNIINNESSSSIRSTEMNHQHHLETATTTASSSSSTNGTNSLFNNTSTSRSLFEGHCFRKAFEAVTSISQGPPPVPVSVLSSKTITNKPSMTTNPCLSSSSLPSPSLSSSVSSPPPKSSIEISTSDNFKTSDLFTSSFDSHHELSSAELKEKMNQNRFPYLNPQHADHLTNNYSLFGTRSRFAGTIRHPSFTVLMKPDVNHPDILSSLIASHVPAEGSTNSCLHPSYVPSVSNNIENHFNQQQIPPVPPNLVTSSDFPHNLAEFMWSMASKAATNPATERTLPYSNFLWPPPPPPPPPPSTIRPLGVSISRTNSSPNNGNGMDNLMTRTDINQNQTEELRKAILLHQHQQQQQLSRGSFPPFLPNFITNFRFIPPSQNVLQAFPGQAYLLGRKDNPNDIVDGNISKQSVKSPDLNTDMFQFRPVISPPQGSTAPNSTLEMMTAKNQLMFDSFHNVANLSASSTSVVGNIFAPNRPNIFNPFLESSTVKPSYINENINNNNKNYIDNMRLKSMDQNNFQQKSEQSDVSLSHPHSLLSFGVNRNEIFFNQNNTATNGSTINGFKRRNGNSNGIYKTKVTKSKNKSEKQVRTLKNVPPLEEIQSECIDLRTVRIENDCGIQKSKNGEKMEISQSTLEVPIQSEDPNGQKECDLTTIKDNHEQKLNIVERSHDDFGRLEENKEKPPPEVFTFDGPNKSPIPNDSTKLALPN